MKMTIVLNERGELVAAQHGPMRNPSHTGSTGEQSTQAGLYAGSGQKLREVDVPDDVAKIQDAQEFHAKIKLHLPKA